MQPEQADADLKTNVERCAGGESSGKTTGWKAEWSDQRGFSDWWDTWRERQDGRDDLGSRPEWCWGLAATQPGALRWIRLQSVSEAIVVPLLLRRSAVDCRLGEVRVLRFRPRLLELAGEYSGVPEDGDAFAAILAAMLAHREEWDGMRFTLPTGSALLGWLQAGGADASGLVHYQPHTAVKHYLLELPPSFREYAAKFTGNTRRNRERELRYLQQLGSVELRCYRRRDEVGAFLEAAEAISRATYQHRLLHGGLLAAVGLRARLELAAEQGWLRAYVLHCSGEPCSFLLGYQYRGRYHHAIVGYDPKWAQWRVGTALHWLALQDMFVQDRPRVIDFGASAAYKAYFGNCHYEETTVYLFRRSFYAWLLRRSHHGSQQLAETFAETLGRFRLKVPVQRAVRRLRGC